MKRTLSILASLLMAAGLSAQDCSVSLSGRNATLSNGTVTAKIGSNGRVSNLSWNDWNALTSNGIYFDYTAKANTQPSYSKAQIIKNTKDMVEVRYTDDSSDLQFQLGYIMRKGVNGIYMYIIANGTSASSSVGLREARVCTRLNDYFTYGYVNDRMQGTLPTAATMKKVDQSGKIQDATFKLPDGSIYTKYNWANFIAEDSVHGAMSPVYKYGVWNIACSHEWLNGGPTRQELTVHADTKSELTIQMIQGEHFGGAAQKYADGEKKIYGPFLIYMNRKNSVEEMIADAKAMAHEQQAAWPFGWFDNANYPSPSQRTTVTGKLNITNYDSADSVQVVLAEPGGDFMHQGKKYIYWATTGKDGQFTIKGVRPDSYTLYAYALKGDITDQLEVNNIDVAGEAMDLGEVSWTPNRYADELLLIGQNNRRADGFNISDSLRAYGLWNKVPENLTFTVGESKEANDWYYAQCHNGVWTILFNSDKTYTGLAHLSFSVAGQANSAKVQCALNGTNIGDRFGFSNDACIYRSATQAGHHRYKVINFNAGLIKKGQNRLTLTMSGIGSNGGMMYDCIKLEAGGLVSSGINGVRNTARPVDDAWYNLQGQRVSKPSVGIYIHNGKKVLVK